MSSSTTSDMVIAAALMIPTLLALLHFARFPYVRASAMPGWFLAIAVVPIVGPLAWAAYAYVRGQHAKTLIEELTAPA